MQGLPGQGNSAAFGPPAGSNNRGRASANSADARAENVAGAAGARPHSAFPLVKGGSNQANNGGEH